MRRAFPLFLLLACVGVSAQELDIFDANDFIDPRDRGAVFLGTNCGPLVVRTVSST